MRDWTKLSQALRNLQFQGCRFTSQQLETQASTKLPKPSVRNIKYQPYEIVTPTIDYVSFALLQTMRMFSFPDIFWAETCEILEIIPRRYKLALPSGAPMRSCFPKKRIKMDKEKLLKALEYPGDTSLAFIIGHNLKP